MMKENAGIKIFVARKTFFLSEYNKGFFPSRTISHQKLLPRTFTRTSALAVFLVLPEKKI